MTKIARYSNGHVDTYKGRRDVKAGWMLVTPEGKIYSGHSIDAATARKTAATYARYGAPFPMFPKPGRAVTVARLNYENKIARDHGFASWAAAYAACTANLEARRAACVVEVVDL